MTETWTTEQELFFLRQEYSILQGALDLANENLRKAEAKLATMNLEDRLSDRELLMLYREWSENTYAASYMMGAEPEFAEEFVANPQQYDLLKGDEADAARIRAAIKTKRGKR